MQANLFGEPQLDASKSQWFTPKWLARRLAAWVPRGARVLEPSCGRGALIHALLWAGHKPHHIAGVELDQEWAAVARIGHFADIWCGDFFQFRLDARPNTYDVVVMNSPFEDNAHMRFVLRALELAPVVVGVFPVSFEYGKERDRMLWSTRGVVTQRARLPERVDYGGDQSPSFDSVVLQIERREAPRAPGDVHLVREEVWTP